MDSLDWQLAIPGREEIILTRAEAERLAWDSLIADTIRRKGEPRGAFHFRGPEGKELPANVVAAGDQAVSRMMELVQASLPEDVVTALLNFAGLAFLASHGDEAGVGRLIESNLLVAKALEESVTIMDLGARG